MLLDRACWFAFLAMVMMTILPVIARADSPSDVPAQSDQADTAGHPQGEPRGRALTGKERLSDKASDDQRVDNCKVPPQERGPRPRPDSCDHR
jgi:hypothetical protein